MKKEPYSSTPFGNMVILLLWGARATTTDFQSKLKLFLLEKKWTSNRQNLFLLMHPKINL